MSEWREDSIEVVVGDEQRGPDPERALRARNAELEQRAARLERELEGLRAFRDAIWRGAIADLERWARTEGLGGSATAPATSRAERRAAVRFPVSHPLRIATLDLSQAFTASLVDISESGLRVDAPCRLPALGVRVACGLFVATGEGDELVLLRGRVVRHVGLAEGKEGFAIAFEESTADPGWLVDRLAAAARPLQIVSSRAGRKGDTLKYGAPIRVAC